MIDLIEHLERQIESSRRLLGVVLAQSEAIRAQDVEAVLARLGDVQSEMVKRVQLERERDALLVQAGAALDLAPEQLTLEDLMVLMPEPEARRARELSAELKGLLAETQRVHGQNRILVRQELAFLDHLMRVLSGTPQSGYTLGGPAPAVQPANLIDMRV